MATPKSLDLEEHRRRLQRRADIEMAIDCHCPVDRAIELVERRRDIGPEGAWDAIKLNISLGQLPAQCIDDRGERVPLEPHWIELLAKFQVPTEPPTFDQPMGTIREFAQFRDFPRDGILWFDRRRAAENRLARKITEDNRTEPSLPPSRVRDVVVDERRLDELYSENAATSEGTAEAIALASDPAAKRISLRVDGQRRLPQKVSKRSAAADWLLCSYPDGIPAGMTDKKLCRDFEEKTETKIDPRTMRRAMGKK